MTAHSIRGHRELMTGLLLQPEEALKSMKQVLKLQVDPIHLETLNGQAQ